MPLVPSPSTGYTDYQTFGNYDSSLLWSIDSFLGTTPVSSPVMNMTKYAALSGFLLCVTNACQCTITWYGDVGLTELIASRTFTLTSQITSGFGALMIPNMGAYAQIVCSNIGGVAFAVNTLIFGTNRQSPLQWSPQLPLIIDQEAQPIGASATVVIYPTDYYAGPIQVATLQSGQNWQWLIQYLPVSGAWTDLVTTPSLNPASWDTRNVIVPFGAWRMEFVNLSAVATTYFVKMTPTATGAT